jgi:glutathione peroxidase-family protein
MKTTKSLLSLLALAFLACHDAPAGDAASVGEAAPAFTIKDASGQTRSLSDYQGKYVILEWVNFGCPFVRKHYDSGHMQTLQREVTAKGVIWLSICSSAPGKQGYFEGEDLTQRLKKEKAVPTAYLVDDEGRVGRAYGAKTTPHMFLISPKGTLLYAGGIDDKPTTDQDDIPSATNYVAQALQSAMSGKEIAVKTSRPYGCSVKYK